VADNTFHCEKIKLSQIFNIFNPKFYNYTGIVTLGCVLLLIRVHTLFSVIITALFWFFAIMMITSRSPSEIELYGRFIRFRDYVSIRPGPFAKTGFWWVRVDYTVTHPVIVSFSQNALERQLDVGRIVIAGEIKFEAERDTEKIPERDTITIYGVKYFSDFKKRFIDK
jgi:hypothetical protein